MIKWKKPNGTEIETNDLPANIERALELGWVRVDDEAAAEAAAAAKLAPKTKK